MMTLVSFDLSKQRVTESGPVCLIMVVSLSLERRVTMCVCMYMCVLFICQYTPVLYIYRYIHINVYLYVYPEGNFVQFSVDLLFH